jgi:hypothetical protein
MSITIIYLLGFIVTMIIGYLFNRYGNFYMQMNFGTTLLLAFGSWCGVITQLLIAVAQINVKWFDAKDIE